MKWDKFLRVAYPEEIATKESHRDIIWRGNRWLSLRLGYVLYSLGISANAVSIGALFTSVIGLCFISTIMNGNKWFPLIGAFLLHLGVFFDFCDGTIARASGKVSKLGGMLDDISCDFSRAGIIILLGIFTRNIFVIVTSIFASYIITSVRNNFIKNEMSYDCNTEANVIQRIYRKILSVVVMLGLLPLLTGLSNFLGLSMPTFSYIVVGIYTALAFSWFVLSIQKFNPTEKKSNQRKG
jgi:phosphatidylglycerophosphate synthase